MSYSELKEFQTTWHGRHLGTLVVHASLKFDLGSKLTLGVKVMGRGEGCDFRTEMFLV